MKRFEAYFFASEIEEVPDYSPNRWNDPFEVEAPVGVPMRLEYEDDEGTHYARAVRTIENEWFDTSFENRSIAFDKARFRPWDDDECRSLDIGPEGVKTLLKALETVHYQPGLEYVIDDLREYLEAFPEAENFEEDNP